MLGRRLRGYDKATAQVMGWLLDGLGDRFDGEFPGVDYELEPQATDGELAQALTRAGAGLLSTVVGTPPVRNDQRAERKRLLRLAKDHPERAVDGAIFLTHAIAACAFDFIQVAARHPDRLSYAPESPAPVEYRALTALAEFLPLADPDRAALDRIQDSEFGELERVVVPIADLDFEGALNARRGGYQLRAVAHAASILAGPAAKELELVRVEDVSTESLIGIVKLGPVWQAFERDYFEILRAVSVGAV